MILLFSINKWWSPSQLSSIVILGDQLAAAVCISNLSINFYIFVNYSPNKYLKNELYKKAPEVSMMRRFISIFYKKNIQH